MHPENKVMIKTRSEVSMGNKSGLFFSPWISMFHTKLQLPRLQSVVSHSRKDPHTLLFHRPARGLAKDLAAPWSHPSLIFHLLSFSFYLPFLFCLVLMLGIKRAAQTAPRDNDSPNGVPPKKIQVRGSSCWNNRQNQGYLWRCC